MPVKLSAPTAESILRNLNDTRLAMHVRRSAAFKAYQAQYRYVLGLGWNPIAFAVESLILEFMYEDMFAAIEHLDAEL